MRSSDTRSDSVKLPKCNTLQLTSHVSSVIETQEPTSTEHCRKVETISEKFVIFFIICGIPPRSRNLSKLPKQESLQFLSQVSSVKETHETLYKHLYHCLESKTTF